MIENRVTSGIKSGMEKGGNFFIVHGDYIHDCFLYDLYNGRMTLNEAYKRFFLAEQDFLYYVLCRSSTFEIYRNEGGSFVATQELTCGRIASDDPLFGLSSPGGNQSAQNEDNTRQAREAAESEASPDKAALLKTVDFCKKNPTCRVAFFFEDFDWTAGLYKSSNDAELFYIEKLLELTKYSNCVVTVSVASAEMLKKYNIDINGSNVEMLGSPAVLEIWHSYLRAHMRRYRRSMTEADFSELYLISEAIGAGDKSLKEAMRIFDRVMEQSNGAIRKSDFESALDKHIEEKVSLDDVVMDEDIKQQIVNCIDTFLSSEDVTEIRKGMILSGPSGTGKTFIVKALANEKNCYFMSPSLADLKGEYVGHTSGKVKRLFQQARANAPTIMFIDEADTVFPLRDGDAGESDSFTKDMVNQFLVEMDGLTTGSSKVFVIAATNRVNVLDNAIKSRLGTKPIEIPLPDKEQRRQLFEKLLRKKEAERFCRMYFFDEFVDKTNRMAGRDIKNFVSELGVEAMKQTRELSQYTDEDEARELFYRVLTRYEASVITDLENKFHITIKRPREGLGYDSIIGCEAVKNAVSRQLRMFDPAQRQRASNYNITPKRGILLYGPPGNGKSQLAEAAASQNNLLFMKITSDTFTKTTLSEQSHTLVKIFSSAVQLSELCSEQAGVMLFFDEFDSLVSKELLDSRIRGTMLTQLDDRDTMRNPSTRVLFVAATNFYERLDEAVVRSGRIDEKIEMTNPSADEAAQMVVQFCRQNPSVLEPTAAQAEDIYARYVRAIEEKNVEILFERCKKDWLRQGRERSALITALNDEVRGEVHPSAASIKGFVNRLIENAYDNDSIDPATGNLVISSEIIDMTCRTVSGTEV